MAKYIDVESLRFPNICVFDMTLHGATVPMVRLVDLQKLVPAADVVEVVRCRECKWWGDAGCAISIVDDTDKPGENDFCSFGERKDGGQDDGT